MFASARGSSHQTVALLCRLPPCWIRARTRAHTHTHTGCVSCSPAGPPPTSYIIFLLHFSVPMATNPSAPQPNKQQPSGESISVNCVWLHCCVFSDPEMPFRSLWIKLCQFLCSMLKITPTISYEIYIFRTTPLQLVTVHCIYTWLNGYSCMINICWRGSKGDAYETRNDNTQFCSTEPETTQASQFLLWELCSIPDSFIY